LPIRYPTQPGAIDRQLNRALHTILLVRLRIDPDTRAYLARRTVEGKAAATPNGASGAQSPTSCSGCWSAMTDPASESSGQVDST
jgi:hypothetical protein